MLFKDPVLTILGYNYMGTQDPNVQYSIPGYGVDTDYRQQVVAVGTPLPTASLPFGKKSLNDFNLSEILQF